MDKEKAFPKRKHPRLDKYDYSTAGAYFITLCTQNRKCVLSRVIMNNTNDPVGRGKAFTAHAPAETHAPFEVQSKTNAPVGRGKAFTTHAPAETHAPANTQNDVNNPVGRGLAPAEIHIAEIEYTDFGKIAEEQLLLLEERYPHLKIDRYVIMPNHIHVIFVLDYKTAGACAVNAFPRPTVMDIVCAYKSLTMRECKKIGFSERVFQTSFYEHIIRGREDYEETVKYIYENPQNWYYDELYSSNQ